MVKRTLRYGPLRPMSLVTSGWSLAKPPPATRIEIGAVPVRVEFVQRLRPAPAGSAHARTRVARFARRLLETGTPFLPSSHPAISSRRDAPSLDALRLSRCMGSRMTQAPPEWPRSAAWSPMLTTLRWCRSTRCACSTRCAFSRHDASLSRCMGSRMAQAPPEWPRSAVWKPVLTAMTRCACLTRCAGSRRDASLSV